MINLLKHFNKARSVSKTDEPIFFCDVAYALHWTSESYESAAHEGFQGNVIAFRAINLISKGIASIPMNWKNCSDGSINEEFNQLFKRPNMSQSFAMFLESVVNYLLISGNAFIHCDENGRFTCLRSDRVKITPTPSRNDVDFYTYHIDISDFRIEKGDLLHIKFFNPLNDWYGQSPLQVALKAIDQQKAMSAHNLAILQNGGRPTGCLLVKSGFEYLTDEQKEQLRHNLQKMYSGTLNAGRLLVLEGDFEWQEMGLSQRDMDFSEGYEVTSREIAEAFGVPPILVGVHGDGGFANYREARLHLWEDTILPLAELIRQEISTWVSKKFRMDVEIAFDLDNLHALSSRREKLWQRISDADFLTVNEKRGILGFPPLSTTNNDMKGGVKDGKDMTNDSNDD